MTELSVIIPTFNEGKYLGKLLNSILIQDYKDYEIIISDNNSTDSTLRIAKNYNCKIVDGGRPAKARNNGAKFAQGKYLLFIDADAVLSENCLGMALKLFKERNLDVAGARYVPYDGNAIDDIFHFISLTVVFILFPFMPHINGGFFLCTKEIFDKVGGFDTSVRVGEDHAFARKAKKLGAKLSILKQIIVYLSVRRFKAEGRLKLGAKYAYALVYRIFFGEIRTKIFEYKWGYKK